MEARVPDFIPIIFFIGLFSFLMFGVISSFLEYHGRCVNCRRFRKKYEKYYVEDQNYPYKNNWFSVCKECYKYPDYSTREEYFINIFKKNILPEKLKNKHMRKWIVNIFLIGIFYEILAFTPKIMDRLLK